jgi:hypothetical protein
VTNSRSLLLACAAAATLSQLAPAAQSQDLRTRAETTDYVETSSYDDVVRIVDGIAAASPLAKQESFGKTEEGRSLPLLILSEPAVAAPEAARRLGRPIVFVQANIHAGEVEGKEASLMLARRLVSGDLKPLLRQLVVLIAPIYNADGNEKVNVMNRTAQYGPVAGVGTRENSKGLDLNRDYMKLDSAEARSLVGLMNRWDPHVAIDLHTTNGSYHGYHLTYSPTLNPNADERLIAFARERLLPAVDAAVEKKNPFRIYYYGNFGTESGGARESSRVDPKNPGDAIWRTFDHRPRFGNNYVGLRNRLAILSEAYSYLDFRGRVRVTEAFVEELLRGVAANATRLTTLTAQLDGEMKAFKTPMGVDFRIAALDQPVDILVGEVSNEPNPRSGREMLAMTEMAVPVRMKDFGIFKATRTIAMPRGWLLPRVHVDSRHFEDAVARLRTHGIVMQKVAAPAEVAVERFVIAGVNRAERPFQGRNETRVSGRYEMAILSAQDGAIFIPAAQPLGRLAFYLLEAESDDGFVTWNLMDAGLTVGETFPIYRVMDVAGLKLQ